MASERSKVREQLRSLSDELRQAYVSNRRVMSFAEYLELAKEEPTRQLRSAPQYIQDCFEYWGQEEVDYAWGKVRRFKLFDCPWAEGRGKLLGQEEVQNQVYRALCNFVDEGTANKLILLHGPNGSAKSTLVGCIGRAMQAYSELPEGATYRFNWIFPGQKVSRGDIGFSKNDFENLDAGESYAHLPDELIDAKVGDELRDHPLLLVPPVKRKELLDEWLGGAGEEANEFVLSDYLRFGQLSHRNRAIYEALLTNYQGDYLKVLRHVQVERFFVSHRYREGFVTVEPQLSVDAVERQITQDRSISALPAALQSLTLYNYGGELVTANRGLIEYSDLLKRPLEAYKYLLTTVEHASVSMQNASLFLDLCFIGTSNEVHLSAFKEIAEFQSFKGRLELIRVPYLLDRHVEERIYEAKLEEAAGSRHVAPHSAYVAALWAVLTRLRKPMADKYPKELKELIDGLTPVAKAELYSEGTPPEGTTNSLARELKAQLPALRKESESYAGYEGRTGASPREMQSILFNAANSSRYDYVSPLAILEEIEELCKHVSVYEFLRLEALPGGYFDHKGLIDAVRDRLLDRVNDEFRVSMGLVEDVEYRRLFDRYILHVMHSSKGEKLRNEATGAMEEADKKLMESVEETLGITGDADDFRRGLISKIGAWSLDHPGEKPDYEGIFSEHFSKLRASYFKERKKVVEHAIEQFLRLVTDGPKGMAKEDLEQARTVHTNLVERFGYSDQSARDLVRALAKARYS